MSSVDSSSSLPRAPLWATLRSAACQALQWRLLLLWWAGLCLPALMIYLPLWRTLAAALDQSMLAPRLASGFDLPLIFELMDVLVSQGPVMPMVALSGLLLTLLMSPWLTGMALTAARQSSVLGFGALLRGGLADYGRMLRMLLWALPVLGVALGVGRTLTHAAEVHATKVILQSDADLWQNLALLALAVMLLLANLTLDAGRAQFVLQLRRTSAVKAWWRGLWRLSWRMGLAYVLLTALGLVLAAGFSWLRLQSPGLLQPLWHLPSWLAGLLALLAGQLVVLVLAWMRCARLFALTTFQRASA